MSWLTEIVFRSRTSREAELLARIDHYRGRAEEAEGTARAAVGNQRRMATDLDARERALEQAHRIIGDLRAQLTARPAEPATVTALCEELAAQKRVNQRLADQLLDAVGHNAQELTPTQRRTLGLPIGGVK
ncbi:hypothetical protein [Streptomyces marianii]|uniref:Uncharacterized protein n=1 Tax=Streptomyces marianii TaxID=1817406 RepID=A0A5R9E0L1_9ACTN|nr:hypothetical protein [Streptomyces marianii]TLQ43458.1 hypothetical protein FEF34_10150 [Streptomyces marianii]